MLAYRLLVVAHWLAQSIREDTTQDVQQRRRHLRVHVHMCVRMCAYNMRARVCVSVRACRGRCQLRVHLGLTNLQRATKAYVHAHMCDCACGLDEPEESHPRQEWAQRTATLRNPPRCTSRARPPAHGCMRVSGERMRACKYPYMHAHAKCMRKARACKTQTQTHARTTGENGSIFLTVLGNLALASIPTMIGTSTTCKKECAMKTGVHA